MRGLARGQTGSGGRERTAEDFHRLFAAAGLTLMRIIPTGMESLIEGMRA